MDRWRQARGFGRAGVSMAMADGAGNVYIADKEAHAIRKVDGAGRITTVAGTGVPGPVDDRPGPATGSTRSPSTAPAGR